jgi:hypothetical protein
MRTFCSVAWVTMLGLACCQAQRATTTPTSADAAASAPSPAAPTSPDWVVYTESKDTLSISANGATRIEVATETGRRTCESMLGNHGNIWTLADLQAALRATDVQAALKAQEIYRSPYPSRASLQIESHTIQWVTAWKELPLDEPAGVRTVREILHGLYSNRHTLCS